MKEGKRKKERGEVEDGGEEEEKGEGMLEEGRGGEVGGKGPKDVTFTVMEGGQDSGPPRPCQIALWETSSFVNWTDNLI